MYAVQYVEDSELPVDWALVRTGSDTVLFLRASAVCPEVLEAAWAGYRRLVTRGVHQIALPAAASL